MQHIELDSLVGKPIVIYTKKGQRKEVGVILSANLDKHGIHINGSITDESLKEQIVMTERQHLTIGG